MPVIIDDIDRLLKLDPAELTKLAAKDPVFFDRLKKYSSQLAHHVAVLSVHAKRSMEDDKEDSEEKKCDEPLTKKAKRDEEATLRYDLAVAHRLTAKLGMDMLVWNHISARFQSGCLITPGRKLWSQINPSDLVFSSTNITADIIHSALYGARPDVKAIIHLHTPAATAVSCLKQGFVPYTQDSAYFYGKVANYKWDGVSNDAAEGPAIAAAVHSVPGCNTLLMHNHGFVCFGQSVKEVWVLAYYFERSCQIQMELLKTNGAAIQEPDKRVMEKAAETSYLPEFAPGACEWEALCKSISFD